jgi:hypothetical protein
MNVSDGINIRPSDSSFPIYLKCELGDNNVIEDMSTVQPKWKI